LEGWLNDKLKGLFKKACPNGTISILWNKLAKDMHRNPNRWIQCQACLHWRCVKRHILESDDFSFETWTCPPVPHQDQDQDQVPRNFCVTEDDMPPFIPIDNLNYRDAATKEMIAEAVIKVEPTGDYESIPVAAALLEVVPSTTGRARQKTRLFSPTDESATAPSKKIPPKEPKARRSDKSEKKSGFVGSSIDARLIVLREDLFDIFDTSPDSWFKTGAVARMQLDWVGKVKNIKTLQEAKNLVRELEKGYLTTVKKAGYNQATWLTKLAGAASFSEVHECANDLEYLVLPVEDIPTLALILILTLTLTLALTLTPTLTLP